MFCVHILRVCCGPQVFGDVCSVPHPVNIDYLFSLCVCVRARLRVPVCVPVCACVRACLCLCVSVRLSLSLCLSPVLHTFAPEQVLPGKAEPTSDGLHRVHVPSPLNFYS